MSRRARGVLWVAGAAIAVGAAVFVLTGRGSDGLTEADLPRVDLAGSEPQVSAAIDTRRRALLDHGASAARWADLAQALHAHELFGPALACYAKAAPLAPDDYRWPYLAGLARAGEDPRAALADYERAAALEPDNAAFYVNWGDLLQQLGRPDDAKRRYARALELAPESLHARLGLARVAIQADALDEAARLLADARAAAPNDAGVHILRSQLLARRGNAEASAHAAERARLAGNPTRAYDPVAAAMEAMAVSSKAESLRGIRLAAQGDFAGAERAFRRVLAVRSGIARDHANLAGALARQRKTKEAIAEYRKALGITPDDVDALSSLGMVLVDAGDVRAGIARLKEALKLDANHFEAHHNLGLAWSRGGERDKAIAHYKEALRLRPGATRVSNDLGAELARQGAVGEAVRIWEAALADDPRNLSLRYNLSVAYVAQGRHADALVLVEEGHRQAPDSSRFLALLAWELATAPDPALRNGDRALEMAQRIVAARPADVQSADLLAAALAEKGRFQEAARLLEDALEARRPRNRAAAAEMAARAALYRKGVPYRQPRR